MQLPRILLVGGGNMGRALLSGWVKNNAFESVVVVDPAPTDALKSICGKTHSIITDLTKIPASYKPNVIVLAIKPQGFDDVLPHLVRFVHADTVFLSIAAGKSIAAMASTLGLDASIVRAMPNMPAMVGRGITACFAGKNCSAVQRDVCAFLMDAVGAVVWLNDENDMHAVTALSGSGPAYVFALIEAMEKAGVELGLDAKLAARLARETVIGAAFLAADRTGQTPADLRQSITSRGGTTAAAMDALLAEDGLNALMARAMALASVRSKMLN